MADSRLRATAFGEMHPLIAACARAFVEAHWDAIEILIALLLRAERLTLEEMMAHANGRLPRRWTGALREAMELSSIRFVVSARS